MPTGSQRVEHDPLEVVLVLASPVERRLELGDAPSVDTLGCLGALGGIARRQEVLAKVGVGLLGRTDQLTESFDLGPECGRILVGTLFGHRAKCTGRPRHTRALG